MQREADHSADDVKKAVDDVADKTKDVADDAKAEVHKHVKQPPPQHDNSTAQALPRPAPRLRFARLGLERHGDGPVKEDLAHTPGRIH